MSNKKKILLVEDDPNFGIILRDFLKMNEYDVILAKNGMEGFPSLLPLSFFSESGVWPQASACIGSRHRVTCSK